MMDGIDGSKVHIAMRIKDLEEIWTIHQGFNLFLEYQFLSTMEEVLPAQIQPLYVAILRGDGSVDLVYFQIKDFDLFDSLHPTVEGQRIKPIKRNPILSEASKLVRFKALVFGNLLLTGPYGSNNLTGKDITSDKLASVSKLVLAWCKERGIVCKATLLKDFEEAVVKDIASFHRFQVQPNMVLEVPKKWNNFQDYLDDMKAKYRIRARRALTKASSITYRSLSVKEIIFHQEEMVQLYYQVVCNVNFNLFYLPADHFLKLKEGLGDRFQVIGCFEGDRLVGFYSLFLNYGEVYAYFLGYDAEVNHSSQLYLNMLYQMIDFAISKGASSVIFSRTAMEIKSSVGAEPLEMDLFVQLSNPFAHKLFPAAFQRFNPSPSWQARSPFRD